MADNEDKRTFLQWIEFVKKTGEINRKKIDFAEVAKIIDDVHWRIEHMQDYILSIENPKAFDDLHATYLF